MKERIRTLMEHTGMTQQEFSQFLEMSPASLSSIFTGRTNPTLNVVELIKKKFDNIDIEWLLFGNGSMFVDDQKDVNQDLDLDGDNATTVTADSQNENLSASNSQYNNNVVTDAQRRPSYANAAPNAPCHNNQPAFSDMKIINTKMRKITEIRVFYDDQTYESFVPKE